MVTKICVNNHVGDIYHVQNCIQIGLGVSVLRMRDFAPLKWLSYFFWFLWKATAETSAPILTQNTSNDAVPRKEVPFGGRETKIYNLDPHFPQKPPFLGPISTGLRIFSPENGFNIGPLESKRPLIVVVAQ